jgi:small-conductance mechanosensitive channel
LRIYAAEMRHHASVGNQLILAGFREHGIDMPFTQIHFYTESTRQHSHNPKASGDITSRQTFIPPPN